MGGTPRDTTGYSLGLDCSRAVASAIKARMAELGIKQAELAKRTDIPASHLSVLLAGKSGDRMLQRWHIIAIAHELQTTEDVLLGSLKALAGGAVPTPPEVLSFIQRHGGGIADDEKGFLRHLPPSNHGTYDDDFLWSLVREHFNQRDRWRSGVDAGKQGALRRGGRPA